MNNSWSEYELLFEILVIGINILLYSAIVAGIIEAVKARRKK